MSPFGGQRGGPFTYDDLARWPSGAEKAEIYAGGLLYSGRFNEDDAAAARRTYPDHEVYIDEHGLWVLPAGTGSLVEHLDHFLPEAEHGSSVGEKSACLRVECVGERIDGGTGGVGDTALDPLDVFGADPGRLRQGLLSHPLGVACIPEPLTQSDSSFGRQRDMLRRLPAGHEVQRFVASHSAATAYMLALW